MIVVSWAYASFAVLVPLKVVAGNKVANVILIFKVALRVDSVKVAKFIDEDLKSGRLIFLCDLLKF